MTGDHRRARSVLDRARSRGPWAEALAAIVEPAVADPDPAWDALLDGGAVDTATALALGVVAGRRLAAGRPIVEPARLARPIAVLDEAVRVGRELPGPLPIPAGRSLGLLLAATGRSDAALDHLDATEIRFRALDAHAEVAETLAARAIVHHRAWCPSMAGRLADEAAHLADRLGHPTTVATLGPLRATRQPSDPGRRAGPAEASPQPPPDAAGRRWEPAGAVESDRSGVPDGRVDRNEVGPDGDAERFVMMSDVVGSSTIGFRYGDEAYFEVVMEHHGLVRAQLARHGGVEFSEGGDSLLAWFRSGLDAVECAHAIQLGAGRARSRGGGLTIKIGVAGGEPFFAAGRPYGSVVNRAARQASMADADEIVVDELVLRRTASFVTSYEIGEAELKGLGLRLIGVLRPVPDLASDSVVR